MRHSFKPRTKQQINCWPPLPSLLSLFFKELFIAHWWACSDCGLSKVPCKMWGIEIILHPPRKLKCICSYTTDTQVIMVMIPGGKTQLASRWRRPVDASCVSCRLSWLFSFFKNSFYMCFVCIYICELHVCSDQEGQKRVTGLDVEGLRS